MYQYVSIDIIPHTNPPGIANRHSQQHIQIAKQIHLRAKNGDFFVVVVVVVVVGGGGGGDAGGGMVIL